MREGGRIEAANPAFATLFGTETLELQGRHLPDLFEEAERERVSGLVRSGIAWSEARGEARARLPDGTPVTIDVETRLFVMASGERWLHVKAAGARERRRLERVHAVALAVSRASNLAPTPDALGRGVLEALKDTIPEAAFLAFFVVSPARDALQAQAELGLGEAWLAEHASQPLGGDCTLLALAARTRESVFVLDTAAESPQHPTTLPASAASIVAAPLLAGDALRGGILAATERGERFSFEDYRCVEIAATEAASALERFDVMARLAAAESRHRAIIEHISDGILVVDEQGTILDANSPARALLGWRETPPRLAEAFPDRAHDINALIGHAILDARATTYLDIRGEEGDCHLRIHGSRAGTAPVRIVLLLEDASAEVRDRRIRHLITALDAAAVRLANEPLPAAIVRAAMEGAQADGAAYLVPGEEGLRVEGGEGRVVEAIRAREDPELLAWIDESCGSRRPSLLAWRDAAGSAPMHLAAIPAVSGERSLGVLVVGHGHRDGAPFSSDDLGWLRVAGEELARVIEHRRSHERTERALEREREALARVKRLNDELKEFTLWTTHDLREPLRSLATLAGYLDEEVAKLGEDEARALARRIARAAETLKDRIFALHDFSLLLKDEAPFIEQDAGKVVARVLDQLSSLIAERGTRVDVARDLPRIRAQAGRFDLVLLNLLENAVKYADPGTPEVRVEGRRRGERVEIAVEDNGAGVPSAMREQVFRPFYRGAAHRNEPGSGTGLAIVRRIVTQHGGDVWVETGSKGGARFVASFPAAGPDATTAPRARPPREPATRRG